MIIGMALLWALLLPLQAEGQLLPTRKDSLARETLLRLPATELDLDLFNRRSETLSLFFIGDVMTHSPMTKSAFEMYRKDHPDAAANRHECYDYTAFFEPVSQWISSADIAVCNMEFPLAGPPFTGYPCFSAPDSYPEYLADLGFDVFLTANNHILDKGDAGLRRTVSICDRFEAERGLRYTGLAATEKDLLERYPLILDKNGVRIALVNFTYGTNSGARYAWPQVNRMRRTEIGEAIDRAKEAGADVIIALPHWGIEYQLRHSPEQEDLARWMIGRGVDLVIGTHPHVVQDIQVIDGKTVIYSLGNAVSNQMDLITRLELCAEVEIRLMKNGMAVVESPRVHYLWCTKPGMITESYTVVPVSSYLETPERWQKREDYDNMVATYRKVQKENNVYEENNPTGSH